MTFMWSVIIGGYVLAVIAPHLKNFKSKEDKPVSKKVVNAPVRRALQCGKDKHTLQDVPYHVLVPLSKPREKVVAVTGIANRQECTVCTHNGGWKNIVAGTQKDVYEVAMDIEEYEDFVQLNKTLVISEENGIIIDMEEDKSE